MASKILQFPTPPRPAQSRSSGIAATPKARADALPDWLQALDVDWIFEEDERRARNDAPQSR